MLTPELQARCLGRRLEGDVPRLVVTVRPHHPHRFPAPHRLLDLSNHCWLRLWSLARLVHRVCRVFGGLHPQLHVSMTKDCAPVLC